MTKEDKIRLTTTMTAELHQSMISKIDRVPENWDGFEFRQWLADTAKETIAYMKMDKQRLWKYQNDRTVRCL